jgi:hypothetical protein
MTPHEATSLASEFARTARLVASKCVKVLMPRQGQGGANISPATAATTERVSSQARDRAVATAYWRHVSQRACRQALNAAWGDKFAATKTTVPPVLIAIFVAVIAGALTKSAIAGMATGLAALVAWTALFFTIQMVTVPATIHADVAGRLDAACKAIRAYNAIVDHSMVRNLLLRMREKCLAYRNNRVTVASQVQWANELLADLSALYGPNAAQTLRRELPFLLDLSASPQTMDFYMRHLADKLLTQIDRVGLDFHWTQRPDLNGFVRRRLTALRAEGEPIAEPAVIKQVVRS